MARGLRLEQRIWTRRGEGTFAGNFVRSPLWLLSGLYNAVMRIRCAAYQKGWVKSVKVPAKVIVVGNLTVGGSGKTPLAAWIARALAGRGLKTAVILRGYKGRASKGPMVVSEGSGPLVDLEEAGDEAYLLAGKLEGTPIITGADRVRAAKLAIDSFGATHLVLDDGFQHLRLARDLDVLAVPAGHDPAMEYLLPRGPLREPVNAAARAHVLVLSGADERTGRFEWMDRTCPNAAVFRMRYRPAGTEPLAGNGDGKKAPCLAFCGIGHPESFFASLDEAGMDVKDKIVFPDHHVYDASQLSAMVKRAKMAGAEQLITTEKDAIKIESDWNRGFPVLVFKVEPDFMGEDDDFIGFLIRLLPDDGELK